MGLETFNVLVVDDVNAMQVQIKELLVQCGFQNIFLAENGEAAKLVLQSTPIQVILCDWHMAPTDGVQLLQAVRAAANGQTIAFLMVTAENSMDKVIEIAQMGVDGYLIKPITLDMVKTKVDAAMKKRKVI